MFDLYKFMKNIQKVIYILCCMSLLTSCVIVGLEPIQPNSVKVTGAGVSIQDQSTVIEYGVVRVFKDSVTRNYTLTNSGEQILNFSAITSDNQDFFVSLERDTTALFPKETLNFSVTFSPRLGGETIGKISFSTNDPAFPIFSFGVKGEGITPPEIVGNNSPQFDDLNTIPLGFGEPNGTLFTVEIYIEDTYNRIDASQLSVELQAIFGNGDRPAPITKSPNEITLSEDKTRLSYSFAVRFGQSNFVDIETKLILGNGDISNAFKTRIERPGGAN